MLNRKVGAGQKQKIYKQTCEVELSSWYDSMQQAKLIILANSVAMCKMANAFFMSLPSQYLSKGKKEKQPFEFVAKFCGISAQT